MDLHEAFAITAPLGAAPAEEAADLESWHEQQDNEARRYESAIVEEARAIASGESALLPSREHLRVLLAWLDGHEPQPVPAWDGRGDPF